jgi:hypothetical protein
VVLTFDAGVSLSGWTQTVWPKRALPFLLSYAVVVPRDKEFGTRGLGDIPAVENWTVDIWNRVFDKAKGR